MQPTSLCGVLALALHPPAASSVIMGEGVACASSFGVACACLNLIACPSLLWHARHIAPQHQPPDALHMSQQTDRPKPARCAWFTQAPVGSCWGGMCCAWPSRQLHLVWVLLPVGVRRTVRSACVCCHPTDSDVTISLSTMSNNTCCSVLRTPTCISTRTRST